MLLNKFFFKDLLNKFLKSQNKFKTLTKGL